MAVNSRSGAAGVLVIFGITEDLARKMTFRALYLLEQRRRLDCPIIGVAAHEVPLDHLLKRAREAIREAAETIDEAVFGQLAGRLSFAQDGESLEPYERLLHDALIGDPHPFARENSVEATWRIVQPLLHDAAPIRPHSPSSSGPAEADALPRGHQRWQPPWLPAGG